MVSTIDVLKNRRSVRSFKDEQISDDDLNLILDAAKNAPSAMNLQSPKILVIQRKEIIDRFAKWNKSFFPQEVLDKFPEDMDPFFGAPTLLIVLADSKIRTCVEDASLVIGNILNASYSIGVGSCWIHRAREEFDSLQGKELLKVWGLSEDYIGVGHVILGYPSSDVEYSDKSIKEDYFEFLDDVI